MKKVDTNDSIPALPSDIVRECGSCTLCCKLLHIPEFDAPAGIWCSQCNPKKGCNIYGNHPKQCKEFQCLWTLGVDKEENRPDKSKMVMKFVLAKQDKILQLQIYCDKGYPHVWRTPFIQKMIDHHTEKGGRTIIIYGGKRTVIGSKKVMKRHMKAIQERDLKGRVLK